MAHRSVSSRWRALSLVLIGIVAGSLLLGTASAHIGTPSHLWNKHIKAKVKAFGDKRWVNVKETSPRAYAWVDPFAGPAFLVAAQTRNFQAVSRPATGVYCLTPAAWIDPLKTSPVVSPEWGQSSGDDLSAYMRMRPFGDCPAGDFEVQTYVAGVASNLVAFTIYVP